MKRNLVLMSLLLLFVASTARAQTATFDLTTAPVIVATTGMSEVLGQVALTADQICGTGGGAPIVGGLGTNDGKCVTTAGTISVTYSGVLIDNGVGTGVTVSESICIAATPCTTPTTIICTTTACTGNLLNGGITASNVVVSSSGVVTFAIKGGIDLGAGDQILINGARGRIATSTSSCAGLDNSPPCSTSPGSVDAFLTASPSTIAAFSPVFQTVARLQPPLLISATPATIISPCQTVLPSPTITAYEQYNVDFVDYGPLVDVNESYPGPPPDVHPYGTGLPGPLLPNARPLFGATNNTYVHFQINFPPTTLVGPPAAPAAIMPGITLGWPGTSTPDGATGGVLSCIGACPSGPSNTYIYDTQCQGWSDANVETFTLGLPAATVLPTGTSPGCAAPGPVTSGGKFTIGLSGTAADFGTSYAQGQLYPVAGTAKPRFNDPLQPVVSSTGPGAPATAYGDVFLTVGPCSTTLLFPWVVGGVAGFDTGIAIANTSRDVWNTTKVFATTPVTPALPIPVTVPTFPQTGACSLYGFPQAVPVGGTPGAVVGFTTVTLAPGDTWAGSMSATTGFGGFLGYVIAVCNFQYGHGFAYISNPFPTPAGGPNAAQGYLALMIPDPRFNTQLAVQSRSACDSSQIAGKTVFGLACVPTGEGLEY